MAQITLRVIDGADRGRVFAQLPTPVTIGREEGNTVQLNDERVSRFHLKIQEDQDKIILTDLESTNGTKVNGEDIQLRILRFGDVIALGRSSLVFGGRDEIARRLADLRGEDEPHGLTRHPSEQPQGGNSPNLEFELNWSNDPDSSQTFQTLTPPDLPQRMSPCQAAQLCELIEYLHLRMRDLLANVKPEGNAKRMGLDERQWQNLIDLQAQLAMYLRAIGEPHDE